MFTQLKDIVPKTAAKFGLKRQFDAAYICQMYRKHAPGIFGNEKCLENAYPKSFKNGTLYISVKNGAYGQQVFMYRKKLVDKINEGLKGDVLKEIRTVVG